MEKFFLVESQSALIDLIVGVVRFTDRKPAVCAGDMAAQKAILALGKNPSHAHKVTRISLWRFDDLGACGIRQKTILG